LRVETLTRQRPAASYGVAFAPNTGALLRISTQPWAQAFGVATSIDAALVRAVIANRVVMRIGVLQKSATNRPVQKSTRLGVRAQ
jgi:hypothetical protein